MSMLDGARRGIEKKTRCSYAFCKLNVFRTPCHKLRHAMEWEEMSLPLALMTLACRSTSRLYLNPSLGASLSPR